MDRNPGVVESGPDALATADEPPADQPVATRPDYSQGTDRSIEEPTAEEAAESVTDDEPEPAGSAGLGVPPQRADEDCPNFGESEPSTELARGSDGTSPSPGQAPEIPPAPAAGSPSAAKPDSRGADAENNRGIAFSRQKRIDEAIACYRRALEIRPEFPEARNNLGIALARKNQAEEAAVCYREALRLRPDYPEAYNNLGIALARLGRSEESVASLQQALRLRPDYPEAHNNLANSLRNLGRTDEAIEHYRLAMASKPRYAEASNNLGNALADKKELEEAVACYRDALRFSPRYAEAHNNLGNALSRMGEQAEAIACYQRALVHHADYAEAYNNLGNSLADTGRVAEAVACYHQALRLKPGYPEAHNNLGIALGKQGKHAEADLHYTEALRLKPDYPDAHLNRALGWLLSGNLEQGWIEYEWRWRCREGARPSFPQPVWSGEPLGGRTILLYAEQGLGDTFQFIRFAALVKRRGGVVVVECQPQLASILARTPGIDRLVPKGNPIPEFHTHCALLSVPAVLRTSLADIPADIPYLYADPACVAEWRRALEPLRGFRIGITWQGNPQYKGDRSRSFPLEAVGPIAALPGVALISLQKSAGTEQLARFNERFSVYDLKSGPVQDPDGFMDTAAVMMNLDLVITCDTSIAHLAGGLGVPTWTALPWSGDWRWLEHRFNSPWYPTMRLFRQPEPGAWDAVFRAMADALRPQLEAPRPCRPVALEVTPGELIDRIAVLEIQAQSSTRDGRAGPIADELAKLLLVYRQAVEPSEKLAALAAELKDVHQRLLEIDAAIRACEREGDFGPRFIELSRSSRKANDRRTALKRQINESVGVVSPDHDSCDSNPLGRPFIGSTRVNARPNTAL